MGTQLIIEGQGGHRCLPKMGWGRVKDIRLCEECGKYWIAARAGAGFAPGLVIWCPMGPIETWWRVYRKRRKA